MSFGEWKAAGFVIWDYPKNGLRRDSPFISYWTTESNKKIRTISSKGSARIEDKGSRFFGVAAPIRDRSSFDELLIETKHGYADANHYCWAFRLGKDPVTEMSSDGGEPSGSAGKPILRVLVGKRLHDVAVVVARYFGGTKLGIGGLMRAYARTTSEAIEDAIIAEKEPTQCYSVELAYPLFSEFKRFLKKMGGVEKETSFKENTVILYEIPESNSREMDEFIVNLTRGTSKPRILKTRIERL